jgi:hypothetical protein
VCLIAVFVQFVEPGQAVLAQIGPLSQTELMAVKKRLTKAISEGLRTQTCCADACAVIPPDAPEWVHCPMQHGLDHCEFHVFKLIQDLKAELGGVVNVLESGAGDGEGSTGEDEAPMQLSLTKELKCGSRVQLWRTMQEKGIAWNPPPEPVRRGTPAVTPRFSLRRATIPEDPDNKENETSPVAPRRLFA